MDALGINGSPRIGGNSDILLDKALEGCRDKGAHTEKIILNTLKFSPCQECENHKSDGTCILEDDMQAVYQKVQDADVIILASPIFFGSLSAQTKMMIDRFQCLWIAKFREYVIKKDIFRTKRKGAFISVEASQKREFFDNAKSIVKNLFATISVDYQAELFISGIDEKGSILEHVDDLKKAFVLGQRIASC